MEIEWGGLETYFITLSSCVHYAARPTRRNQMDFRGWAHRPSPSRQPDYAKWINECQYTMDIIIRNVDNETDRAEKKKPRTSCKTSGFDWMEFGLATRNPVDC